MRHIAIIGSRNFSQLKLVHEVIDFLPESDVIITGGAIGVDQAALDACKKLGRVAMVYYPNWDEFGLKAGLMRNKLMVEKADLVYAFWDGTSPGTRFTINAALEADKPVIIYK